MRYNLIKERVVCVVCSALVRGNMSARTRIAYTFRLTTSKSNNILIQLLVRIVKKWIRENFISTHLPVECHKSGQSAYACRLSQLPLGASDSLEIWKLVRSSQMLESWQWCWRFTFYRAQRTNLLLGGWIYWDALFFHSIRLCFSSAPPHGLLAFVDRLRSH